MRYLALSLSLLLFAAGLVAISAADEVNTAPLPVKIERAFPKLDLRNPLDAEQGLIRLPRPVALTHAGDGTNRVFMLEQRGVVHLTPNDQGADKSVIFLDLSESVVYKDQENEEGLLGIAFHPRYRENGQFFLYYTTADEPHTSVISRFRVDPKQPNRADPKSEEELLRIKQPFWNHNGGNLAFGPDGGLYIGLGDGGAADDPLKNGQNLATLLGSILRIDVDRRGEGTAYAIPKDNPFVGIEGARPEIYAYGVRNIWGMSFDRKTGVYWAADVGQNLWEEINLIVKGGNYGWSLREGFHPFGPKGVGPRKDLIDPIWEYHHDIGKSITGGFVYRGREVPSLEGLYVYADYITGKIWALEYDFEKKKVVANRPILGNTAQIMAFGEDEPGELYFTTTSGQIFRFREGAK